MILLNIFFYFLIPIIVLVFVYHSYKYDKSNYKKESNNSYFKVLSNKGTYGEYQIFKTLSKAKGKHKLIVNAYIPTYNDKNTEIDLIYIHESGIYVIESKNYSGQIFGDEDSKQWMQIIGEGYNYKFYNPIWQNNTHIKYLKKILGDIKTNNYKSIIVFSDKCKLKQIDTHSDVRVINKCNLVKTVKELTKNSDVMLTEEEITKVYNRLKPYTRVNNTLKEQHIQDVRKYQNDSFKH